MTLLHSESSEFYIQKREEFYQRWNKSFIEYFTKNIEEALLATYRPVLEEIHLYNIISGITNNPAESANAAFKRATNNEKGNLFQASSAWYFHQVHALTEIITGIAGEGEYQLNLPTVPSKLYITDDVKDFVGPDLISRLIYHGEIPRELFTNKSTASLPLHERLSIQGRAEFLRVNERVKLCPVEAVFLVTGFLGKVFKVMCI